MADTGNVNVDTLAAFIDTHEFVGDTDVEAARAALSDLAARARVAGKWESDYVDCVERAEADRDRLLGELSVSRQAGDEARSHYMELEAEADRLARRVAELEAALRAEFFKRLPDLDYEILAGVWAWQDDPLFKLLGLTDEECVAALAGDGGGA